MRKINKILLVATALTMVTSAAFAADNNKSYIDQDGTENTATINQSGGDANQFGTNLNHAEQLGSDSTIKIVQSGGFGAGNGRNKIGTRGNGFIQSSNGSRNFGGTQPGEKEVNYFEATQTGYRNLIGEVNQTSLGFSDVDGPNVAIITQAGDRNKILRLKQTTNGGPRNDVKIVTTLGADRNRIALIKQTSPALGYYTDISNSIDVLLTGSDNGQNGFGDDYAAASGAQASKLIQNGLGNTMKLEISGYSNEFGITQIGDENTVNTVSISGHDNLLGIYQAGNNNIVNVTDIAGNGNVIGIRQLQDSNIATLNILGVADRNRVSIYQDGYANTAILTIDGAFTADDNDVQISSIGNDNEVVGIIKSSYNVAIVNQNGNGNIAHFTQISSNSNSVNITQ